MLQLSANKLSFADNMWDGIEIIKEKSEVGLKSCKDVLDFFKRLASLEEEYAKNIGGLLQKYQSTSSNLTLSQGWKGVINVLSIQAETHKNLSMNFVTNLCHPLQALLKDMESRRKLLVMESIKQKAELRDNAELVKKAKIRYDKSAKDLEAARNELAQSKASYDEAKIFKSDKNYAGKEGEMSNVEAQYKSQLTASNVFLDSHQQEKWPDVLNEFEQFEVTRISFMKSNIANFMGLLKEVPLVLDAEIANGMKMAEQIEPENDLQLFIDANKTRKELLHPFAFEPYQATIRTSQLSIASRPISKLWADLGLLGSKDEDKNVFGASLTDLMNKQQKEDPNLQIPKIIATLSEGIAALNGYNTEGIFRLSPSASEVNNMRKQLDKGDYNISAVTDVHVLATLLKQFLRELPEAVVPTAFYEECVNGDLTPEALFSKLPPIHQTVLLYTLNLLQMFIQPEHLQVNKMTTANLSTIFAPVLLRSPQQEPSALLANLTNELGFTEKLILAVPLMDEEQFPIFKLLHNPHIPNPKVFGRNRTKITSHGSMALSPPLSHDTTNVESSPSIEVGSLINSSDLNREASEQIDQNLDQ